MSDLEVVPAAQLRAAAHAGGHVVGAYRGAALVGFAYAMVAVAHGRGMSGTGLHSHMVAVSANERGSGIGRSLKWFQRRLALAQGLSWITWTFDPLQARNAKLNLEHLGAVSHDYLVDFYGPMSGPLGGGQASDRLLALWLLDSPKVRRLAGLQDPAGYEQPMSGQGAATQASRVDDDGRATGGQATWLLEPGDVEGHRAAGHDSLREAVVEVTRSFIAQHDPNKREPADEPSAVAKVAAPISATELLASAPELASLWRCGMRAAMTEGLAAGLVVVGFQDGAYSLEFQSKMQAEL